MSQRRPLLEGLKALPDVPDPAAAARFITGTGLPDDLPVTPTPLPAAESVSVPLRGVGRVLLSVRVRPDLAAAFKRISLERQLAGVTPSALQDLVEDALGRWLADEGERA